MKKLLTVALIVFAILTRRRGHPAAPWVLAATGVFLLSLTMRTMDQAVCPWLPMGTHYFWHLLNGLLVYLIVRGLLVNLPVTSRQKKI